MKKQILWLTIAYLLATGAAHADRWAFGVLADNRDRFQNYRYVLEQVKRINNDPEIYSVPIEFMAGVGDIDPLAENDAIYKEFFPNEKPLYFPIMGNHEIDKDADRDYMTQVILPRLGDTITRNSDEHGNYYCDWENVRFIALDQYSDFGVGNDKGWITAEGAAWLEDVITSATNADHIFVSCHEPVFPRKRHLRPDGLGVDELNAWKMLVSYSDKIRAVFVAHTHNYSRMRVINPTSAKTGYPDQEDGVYQVDVGNAGNTWEGDGKHTLVKVEIDGMDVLFRVFQTPENKNEFTETDRWEIKGTESEQKPHLKPALYWSNLDDRHGYEPGQVITRALMAHSFSDEPDNDYQMTWSIIDADNRKVATGNRSFDVAPREKKEIFRLSVPTENAKLGDIWTLKSEWTDGEEVAMEQVEKFTFPCYSSLEGLWHITKGDDHNWAKSECDDTSWKWTVIPNGWENDALPDYDGIAWYRLRFSISDQKLESWGEKPLAIVLGAIDDADETFLNGVLIGQTGEFPPAKVTAWDTLRFYEFDRHLLKKDNILAIRVSDWGGGGGIWKGPVAIGPTDELRIVTELSD